FWWADTRQAAGNEGEGNAETEPRGEKSFHAGSVAPAARSCKSRAISFPLPTFPRLRWTGARFDDANDGERRTLNLERRTPSPESRVRSPQRPNRLSAPEISSGDGNSSWLSPTNE